MSKVRKIYCPNEKKFVPYGLFNGYGIGDRLLEDVYFRVSFDANNNTEVVISPDAKDYFDQFNSDYWYNAIKKEIDDHGDILTCPYCEDDCEIQ